MTTVVGFLLGCLLGCALWRYYHTPRKGAVIDETIKAVRESTYRRRESDPPHEYGGKIGGNGNGHH